MFNVSSAITGRCAHHHRTPPPPLTLEDVQALTDECRRMKGQGGLQGAFDSVPFQQVVHSLQRVHEEIPSDDVLLPVGMVYLMVPESDLIEYSVPYYTYTHLLYPSRCSVMRVTDVKLLCGQLLPIKKSITDHLPSKLAYAIGITAKESEDAQTMHITAAVPP
eukprot:GHVO01016889.1.p2 GENE.GHVO01016889.1~~GHVO01016889.1.p2  ORF type:complete len:163 (+),score=40.29 GHVO01016889.1:632-1120(+)